MRPPLSLSRADAMTLPSLICEAGCHRKKIPREKDEKKKKKNESTTIFMSNSDLASSVLRHVLFFRHCSVLIVILALFPFFLLIFDLARSAFSPLLLIHCETQTETTKKQKERNRFVSLRQTIKEPFFAFPRSQRQTRSCKYPFLRRLAAN